MTSKQQSTHQAAITAINQGDYSRAESLCRQLLQYDNRFADAWFLLAMSAAGRLQVGKAIELLFKAIQLAPGNAEYLAQYAKLLSMVNQDQKALMAAKQALQAQPEQALTWDTLGVVLSKLGEHELAQETLTKAVSLKPADSQFHFNLASAEQFLGHAEQAEHHYRSAIRYRPGFARAYWALSELNKNSIDDQDLEVLEELINTKGISDEDELYYAHALSRTYEQHSRYADAFDILTRAKFRYRAKLNYSWVVDQRLFTALEQAFPLKKRPEVDPELGGEAIFIAGMPRTGTTLAERILSSHSEVESLGELQNFGLAVKRESKSSSRSVLDSSVIQASANLDFEAVGKRYLASLSNRGEAARFIDKMPLNFLYIPYITEALPAAKIVLLRRHPLDTILSNYRQLFAMSFSYYNYHYDLTDTAHYYRLFDALVRYWQSLYGDRIHVVDYEALVSEPQKQVSELLSYCGLEWQDACMAFHENTEAVATASAMQVRQPIYQSAVARWKNYAEELGPAIEILKEHGLLTDLER